MTRLRPFIALPLAAAALLSLLLALPAPSLAGRDRYEVVLDGHRLEVELAITREERMRGLSGRTHLGPDKGMLFLYQKKMPLRFWMAGMRIPLDLLWLSGSRVVGIEQDIEPPAPGQTPRMVFSPGPVDRVLEVPAGWTRKHGVGKGAVLVGPKRF